VSTPAQPDLSTIVSRWPIRATEVSPLQSSGFSGANLWKIDTTDSKSLCLKNYRGGALTVGQLDGIHRVLIHAFNEGCDFIAKPMRLTDGFTTVVAGPKNSPSKGLWDLSTWAPGGAITSFSDSQIENAFASIARFHKAAAQVNLAFGPSPNLGQRQMQLEKLVRPESAMLDQAASQLKSASIHPTLQETLATLVDLLCRVPQSQIASLQNRLSEFSKMDLPLHPVVRDLRAEHLLFTDDQLTGLVDFDAMQMDSVAYDLSRLTSSMRLSEHQLHLALSTYHASRPIQAAEAKLIQLLTAVGRLLAPLSWINWLVLERRSFSNLSAVQRRLKEVADDLIQHA
jgi:homoserine kinase type II